MVDMVEVAERWRAYARSGRGRAILDRQKGDLFGAALHLARAEVREQAAKLLDDFASAPEAARTLIERAAELRQLHPPLWGGTTPEARLAFDARLCRYTACRTWQACAQELDPTVAEVQPRWP